MLYDFFDMLGFKRQGADDARLTPNRAQRRAAVKRRRSAAQTAARKGGK